MADLRQCPFCGEKERLYHAENITGLHYIECDKCGAAPSRLGAFDYETAIRYWNGELMPTIAAEPVRQGRWIECDYKTIEHGMLETEPKAGLCCSECRTGFKKSKMTFKQYCAACGAKMDADHIADDSKKVGGADNG